MGRASVPTPTLYPAFFFVLGKAAKSAGNAVIPTFPAHCPHGLQHLRHKRPTFAFTPENEYTLAFAQKIAHSGLHAETGAVSDGGAITTLGAFHTFRKPCVARCQNGKLCRFCALIRCAPEERREPSEQRCAYARRCPAGVAAPLGCVIFSLLPKLRLVHPALSAFRMCETRGGITTLGALCVLLKHSAPACQSDSFVIF